MALELLDNHRGEKKNFHASYRTQILKIKWITDINIKPKLPKF